MEIPAEPRIIWPAGTTVEPPNERGVHVWTASLQVSAERLTALASTLSPDERHRADAFRRAELTRRFVAARGMLRELLGAYLDVSPPRVAFEYGAHRKPRLAEHARMPLEFNVAHSADLALYAIASTRAVGIDVEQIIPFADMANVAQSMFAEAECAQLARTPPDEYVRTFYCVWTRKEAYVKALGTGLMAPLDTFDVSAAPLIRPVRLHVHGDPDASERWTLVHLEPADGYLGAVAMPSPAVEVTCRRWP